MIPQFEYVYTKAVQISLLDKELRAINEQHLQGRYVGLSISLGQVSVKTKAELYPAEKLMIDAVIAAHDQTKADTEEIANFRQRAQKKFGMELIDQFAQENLAMKLSGLAIGTMLQAMIPGVWPALSTGTLSSARYAIGLLPVMEGLTQERKQRYIQQIDDFVATLPAI
jgi:hypothetical protein